MSTISGINLENEKYNITLPFLASGFTTTAGSSTSGAYLAAKWAVADVNGITTPVNGMTIAVRVPLAGNSGGVLLSIDGGTTYYPIVRNVSTLVTTNYAVGSTIILTFNSTQTAKPYLTAGTTTTVTGCWQIADYDGDTKVTQTVRTTNGEFPILLRGTSAGTSTTTTTTTFGTGVTVNPSTKTITATTFKGTATKATQDGNGNIITDTYAPIDSPEFTTSVSLGRTEDNVIGEYSVGMGFGVTASSIGTHAEGCLTVASKDYAHAEGLSSTASGLDSHAEGYGTIASGDNSHAEGSESKAEGPGSHAEGELTIASGYYSHTEGYKTEASSHSAHAEGNETTASGAHSHAEGRNTAAAGSYSHAEGSNTAASGEASHAEGDGTQAIGENSHAEGGYTSSIPGYTHPALIVSKDDYPVIDESITIYGPAARGIQSHAEGTQTLAHGYSSHAEGSQTKALGNSCHAEGSGSMAYGYSSHAEGSETIAASMEQHAQGRYNIEDADEVYAHIVGNGTDDSARSNAHTLDWDGNAWFAGDVYVGGTNQTTGSSKLVKSSDLSSYAPKASPALTGTPTAPTAAAGTNTTQIATTAFVATAVSSKAPTSHASTATTYGVGTTSNYGHVKISNGDADTVATANGLAAGMDHTHSLLAPKASPTFTGTPKAPTAAAGTNTTQIATTAFVTTAVSGKANSSHNQAASTITAGTLGGKVLANATAAATLTDAQVRNIKASTTDLTAGTSSLTTGDIYIVYE